MADRLCREGVAFLYGAVHNTTRLTGIHLIPINYTPVSAHVGMKLPSYSGFSSSSRRDACFVCMQF